MPKKRSQRVLACPQGHRDDLLLRLVVDVPAMLDGGVVNGHLSDESQIDVVEGGGTPGVDGGVWCPTCEEWYEESDCIHPADAAPVMPGKGDAHT